MRLGLAIAAMLRAAHPASEEDDRPRYEARAPVEASAPAGPMLNWSNKRAYATPSGQPSPYARPEPMALAGQFSRGRQEAPPPAELAPPPGERQATTYRPPAYQPFTPQTPYQAPRAAPPAPSLEQPASPPIRAPLPSSLYSGPPPLPEQAAIAAPQRLADASATARSVGGSSKLYSVHRAYGLEPDLIPEPPAGDRYVFIGPPDAPKAKTADDDSRDESDDGDGRPF